MVKVIKKNLDLSPIVFKVLDFPDVRDTVEVLKHLLEECEEDGFIIDCVIVADGDKIYLKKGRDKTIIFDSTIHWPERVNSWVDEFRLSGERRLSTYVNDNYYV